MRALSSLGNLVRSEEPLERSGGAKSKRKKSMNHNHSTPGCGDCLDSRNNSFILFPSRMNCPRQLDIGRSNFCVCTLRDL